MSDGSDALQTAIVQHLRSALAAASLPTLEGGQVAVVDFVTESTAFPYVVVGETLASEWDTKDSQGLDQILTLEVWSRYRGRKQCREIASAIYDASHLADLALVGHHLVLLRFDSLDLERAADGLSHVARLRYRALTDQP